jgi:hypothetical protein
LMVVGRPFCCYDLIDCLNPLLSQSEKGRAFWGHALDRLHDHLEPYNIEVRVHILNQSVIRRPGVGRF